MFLDTTSIPPTTASFLQPQPVQNLALRAIASPEMPQGSEIEAIEGNSEFYSQSFTVNTKDRAASGFSQSKLKPTKRGNPCPICSDITGKCREGESLHLCMETLDGHATPSGFKFVGQSKDGMWGLFIEDNGHQQSEREREQWQREQAAKQREQALEAERRNAASMPAIERDRHYRTLLGQLTLNATDRADLTRRGLSDQQIEAGGYKSVEQWQRLSSPLPNTLPGVSLDGRSLNTQAGYLTPIFDKDGLIVGCQVRARGGSKGDRYRWLTSHTKHRPNGAQPNLPNGELPFMVARPVDDVTRPGIGITEGIIKPFIAAQTLNQVVIGAVGRLFASSPETLKTTLEQLAAELGTKQIDFYPDAGSPLDPHTLRQYRAAWKLMQQWGYQVRIAWWGQADKSHPDIDELRDLGEIAYLTVAEFEGLVPSQDGILKGIRKFLGGLTRQPVANGFAPSAPKLERSPKTEVIQYESGDRLKVWQSAVSDGYRYILDSTPPGNGKSYDAGRIIPKDFGAGSVIYSSGQHRNPTVDTLKGSNEWVDLEGRHSGLIREHTPGGGSRLRRAKPGEQTFTIPPNCSRTSVIGALREKAVEGADTSKLICGTCPLKEQCGHTSGYGYGFLNERRSSLSAVKMRAHPDSLPAPDDFDYSSYLHIWDEPGENFKSKHDILISLPDLQQTISALLKADQLAPVQELLTVLLSLVDGSTKTGRYGLSQVQIMELLPDTSAINIEAVEQAIAPDLSFLNTTSDYGVDLADLSPKLRRQFSEKQWETTQKAGEQIAKQWLPALLQVISGNRGYLSLRGGVLVLSLPTDRHREIAEVSKANIFLDATLSREDLALMLGCSADEILEVRQVTPENMNLEIVQVMDLGRLGQQRGKDQMQRATAIMSHYRTADPDGTQVIDFKKYAEDGDGAWWVDSRGTNDFQSARTLILTGTPCTNLADLQAKFAILTGSIDFEGDEFKSFVDRDIQATIAQGVGRIRANRRLNEKLSVVLLTNFELGIPTQKVKAIDICPEAGTKVERLTAAVQGVITELKEQGEKVTQSAIAAIVGCSQARISQLWKIINFAIGDSNSEIYNSESPPPDPDLVQIAEAVLTEANTAELLGSLSDIFFGYLKPEQWQQTWGLLSRQAQSKLLAALLLTLPDVELKKLEAIS